MDTLQEKLNKRWETRRKKADKIKKGWGKPIRLRKIKAIKREVV